MNKRIRYSKVTDVLLRSNRALYSKDNRSFIVEINRFENKFYIWEGAQIISEGTGTSMHSVKINAKNKLIMLGVEFIKEMRNR